MPEQQIDLFRPNKDPLVTIQKRPSSGHIFSNFSPERIILTKGSMDTLERKAFAHRICSFFPQATIVEYPDTPHNRINTGSERDAFKRHMKGKKTLVLGVMKSAVRLSDESGNTCPNYWHYSVFGFCPFECAYCYLAGTPGVWYSPSVKIYINLSDIIATIDRQARTIAQPVSFYHGKLQDGLALEPITSYMQTLIPFFARHSFARHIILTKSDAVNSLLSLEHGGHTILSWSLNPPEIASYYELNTPPIEARIHAMKRCAGAGYPVRAVLMPVIPAPGWKKLYGNFLEYLLTEIPLARLTIGGICSYAHAHKLMIHHIGHSNSISVHMSNRCSSGDGRRRYSPRLRIDMYRFLVDKVRSIRPNLPIGLCLEETNIWQAVDPGLKPGICNCVL